MDAVIFIGVQGSGKSTFYKERFADTHVRINLDMLRTRHRESLLLAACIQTQQPLVIDNTNPTRDERARYISLLKAASMRIRGFYFKSDIASCKARNAQRAEPVPLPGLLGTHAKLELPRFDEGFDELSYVSCLDAGGFAIEPWRDQPDPSSGGSQ